ncbi:hypothetical protein NLG97_g3500 [Lecanicillium saksenae]|uniref:Uncharacterized protein n=1 Tax=Lecanicillium saksenae TaxID=468837 RepID=A0ACC1QY38_9HYPO|nr:hypothetical protein NLG97_g3500 [Lecanicillium saksenae]
MGAKSENRMYHLSVSLPPRFYTNVSVLQSANSANYYDEVLAMPCDIAIPARNRQRPLDIRPKLDQTSHIASLQLAADAPQHPQPPTLTRSPGQHPATIEYDWMEACHGWAARLRRLFTTERSIIKEFPYTGETWFFSHPDILKPVIILSALATELKKEHTTMTGCPDSGRQLDVARRMNLYKQYKGTEISSLSRDLANPNSYMKKMVLRRLANLLVSENMSGEGNDKMIGAAAAIILASIQSFVPETWNERPQLRNFEVRLLLAQIYQSATEIFLRLSLSDHMNDPLSPTQRFALAERTTAVAERLQLHCGYHLSAAWPLAVAGAALGCGPIAQQVRIDGHLQATADLYSSSRGTLATLHCLRKFWSSGKTSWEDCFTEWQHTS